MLTDLLRKNARWFGLSSLIALSSPMAGCAGQIGLEDDVDTFDEEITDVNHSAVKRQSIGNCWLYAMATWLESLHKSATGVELNASESYWTYWHWFDQIVAGSATSEIQTGGYWSTASTIIQKYGIIPEGDFIPSEATVEMSLRQKSALDAINLSLKSGALSTATARRSKATVRKELDKAFGLEPTVVAQLDKVFGVTVARNLTTRSTTTGNFTASTFGTQIKRAKDVPAAYTSGPGTPLAKKTVEEALNTWRMTNYPWNPSGVRAFEQRFQRALHDAQPVVISWFVDFNALDEKGRFFAPPATPGRQGGHMTACFGPWRSRRSEHGDRADRSMAIT